MNPNDANEQCASEYALCPEHDRRCIQAADHVARSPLHYNRAGFAWSDDEAREAAGESQASEDLSSEAEARAHAEVDGMFGPDDDCGGQTLDPPCGSCRRCAHMQVSYGFDQARKAATESRQ